MWRTTVPKNQVSNNESRKRPGKCSELIEYKSPERESFILNTMALLTKGLTVSVHQIGDGPAQVFVGQLIATPTDEMREGDVGRYQASLSYDGWMFEDHGYQFHWFESEPSGTGVVASPGVMNNANTGTAFANSSQSKDPGAH
jgi:hypothetical protein